MRQKEAEVKRSRYAPRQAGISICTFVLVKQAKWVPTDVDEESPEKVEVGVVDCASVLVKQVLLYW